MVNFETIKKYVETGLNKYMNSPFSFEISGGMFWEDKNFGKMNFEVNTLVVTTDCMTFTFHVYKDQVNSSYIRQNDGYEPEFVSQVDDFDTSNINQLVNCILGFILVDDLDDSEVDDGSEPDETWPEGVNGRHELWEYDYANGLLVF